jgi:hypothetical protein
VITADIWLYPPATPNPNDIILSWGLRPVTTVAPDIFFPKPLLDSRGQPVWAASMYTAMVSRYGLAEGERIYYAMAREHKGPFADQRKYAARRPVEASVPVKPQLPVSTSLPVDRVTAAVPPVPPRVAPPPSIPKPPVTRKRKH